MIITFNELNRKQYEIQNKDVDDIYEDAKTAIINVLAKYHKTNKDLFTVIFAFNSISSSMCQALSDEYGANKIIEAIGATEL